MVSQHLVKKKPIPDFGTYEEAACFFDKTDTTALEYDEELFTTFPSAQAPRRRGTADSQRELFSGLADPERGVAERNETHEE